MQNHIHDKRHLPFDFLFNARDLGGLPTRDAKQTRFRSLARSESPHTLNPAQLSAMVDFGVRSVIDLRFHGELAQLPNPFRLRDDVRFTHISLMGEEGDEIYERDRGMSPHSHWAKMVLDLGQKNIASVMRAIADAPDGAILFHCHAGKDRTGIVADLLLSLSNVADEIIIDDYLLSNERWRNLRENALAKIDDAAGRERMSDMWLLKRQTAVDALDHLATKYGGAEKYLRLCGLTSDEIGSLRKRMI
jgi:protein-tyrosine phosphatase